MNEKDRIEWSVYLLRFGVFVVMFAWTLDKFLNPGHAAKIFENFYFIDGLGEEIMMVIGAIELVIIFAFLGGL